MHETISELLEKHRLDLNDARWVLGEATRRLVPSEELDGWWDGYSSVAMAFAASENVCAQSMREMRKSLEYVRPFRSDDPAEFLIAASKMVLSALVIFTSNPTGGLLYERDIMHDDLDPLIRKAVDLLDAVAGEIDADAERGIVRYVVEFDSDFPERVTERNERNRLKHLVDTAIRPPV